MLGLQQECSSQALYIHFCEHPCKLTICNLFFTLALLFLWSYRAYISSIKWLHFKSNWKIWKPCHWTELWLLNNTVVILDWMYTLHRIWKMTNQIKVIGKAMILNLGLLCQKQMTYQWVIITPWLLVIQEFWSSNSARLIVEPALTLILTEQCSQ